MRRHLPQSPQGDEEIGRASQQANISTTDKEESHDSPRGHAWPFLLALVIVGGHVFALFLLAIVLRSMLVSLIVICISGIVTWMVFFAKTTAKQTRAQGGNPDIMDDRITPVDVFLEKFAEPTVESKPSVQMPIASDPIRTPQSLQAIDVPRDRNISSVITRSSHIPYRCSQRRSNSASWSVDHSTGLRESSQRDRIDDW